MSERSAAPWARVRHHRLVMAVVYVAVIIISVDNFILTLALPTMAVDLDASTSELQWIVDAYVLVYAGLLMVGGSLGDRFGRAKIQLVGFAVFGLGSLGGALSSTTAHLVLSRGAMGVGAALILPASLAMIAHIYPEPRDRRRAYGLWATAGGIGLALGPVLGGALLSRFWWGSVFLINVPIVAVAFIGAWLFLPESRDEHARRLDLLGFGLSIAGVTALVWATIEAPIHGWTSSATVLAFAAAAVMLGAFVAWEMCCAEPMLELGLFRIRRFTAGTVCAVATQFAVAGTLFSLTQLLQSVQGYSPFAAGMRIMPYAAAFAVAGVCSSKVTELLTPRGVVALGNLTCAAGLVLLMFVSAGSGAVTVFVATLLMGAGAGATVGPTNDATMSSVTAGRSGAAAGILATVRQVSVALGVAVMGSVLVSGYQPRVRHVLDALGLVGDDRARSLDSVGSALQVSRSLPGGGEVLARAARDAFSYGMHLGSVVGAILLVVSAVVAWSALPSSVAHPPTVSADDAAALTH